MIFNIRKQLHSAHDPAPPRHRSRRRMIRIGIYGLLSRCEDVIPARRKREDIVVRRRMPDKPHYKKHRAYRIDKLYAFYYK